jgi:hypothetical protein
MVRVGFTQNLQRTSDFRHAPGAYCENRFIFAISGFASTGTGLALAHGAR